MADKPVAKRPLDVIESVKISTDPRFVHEANHHDDDLIQKGIAMNQTADESVYDQTYRHYLQQLKSQSFKDRADVLGITFEDDTAVVPYFGRPIRLTSGGLVDENGRRPEFSDCVVVCRYLIMAPVLEPRDKTWVAYREFPDAGPLTVFWRDTVEGPLAQTFAGHVKTLSRACSVLGGRLPDTDIACDLCRYFLPLPKVSLLLVFNDRDDEFPAAASLLFEKRAASYLDAESQAILGNGLTGRLLAMMRV